MEVSQVIDYSPLWETMKNKNITQYKLLKEGINHRVLDALKKSFLLFCAFALV